VRRSRPSSLWPFTCFPPSVATMESKSSLLGVDRSYCIRFAFSFCGQRKIVLFFVIFFLSGACYFFPLCRKTLLVAFSLLLGLQESVPEEFIAFLNVFPPVFRSFPSHLLTVMGFSLSALSFRVPTRKVSTGISCS